MLKKLYALTQKVHHLMKTTIKRPVIIVGTFLAGMLLNFIFFGNDENVIKAIDNIVVSIEGDFKNHYFYTKYTVSFLRSFLMLMLTVTAVMITESKRLAYVLVPLLVISMSLDYLFILSSGLYFTLEHLRYNAWYNFRDLYGTLEVICVIWTFITGGFLYLKSISSDYFRNHLNISGLYRS